MFFTKVKEFFSKGGDKKKNSAATDRIYREAYTSVTQLPIKGKIMNVVSLTPVPHLGSESLQYHGFAILLEQSCEVILYHVESGSGSASQGDESPLRPMSEANPSFSATPSTPRPTATNHRGHPFHVSIKFDDKLTDRTVHYYGNGLLLFFRSTLGSKMEALKGCFLPTLRALEPKAGKEPILLHAKPLIDKEPMVRSPIFQIAGRPEGAGARLGFLCKKECIALVVARNQHDSEWSTRECSIHQVNAQVAENTDVSQIPQLFIRSNGSLVVWYRVADSSGKLPVTSIPVEGPIRHFTGPPLLEGSPRPALACSDLILFLSRGNLHFLDTAQLDAAPSKAASTGKTAFMPLNTVALMPLDDAKPDSNASSGDTIDWLPSSAEGYSAVIKGKQRIILIEVNPPNDPLLRSKLRVEIKPTLGPKDPLPQVVTLPKPEPYEVMETDNMLLLGSSGTVKGFLCPAEPSQGVTTVEGFQRKLCFGSGTNLLALSPMLYGFVEWDPTGGLFVWSRTIGGLSYEGPEL